MIEIEGPDGVIYEFPEGTDDATMARAMQQVYGQPQAAQPEPLPEQPVLTPEQQARAEYENPTGLAGVLRAINDPLGRFNRAFTNGYTLGAADEIEGAADALMTDQTYGQAVEAARARADAGSAEYPVISALANALGGVSQSANIARGLGMTAPTTLGGQMVQGAQLGAIEGGIYGFNEGSGLGRVTGAAQNAALGAGVGAAAPAVISGVRAGYDAALAGPIASMRSAASPTRASQAVQTAINRSGRTPQELADAITAARAAGQTGYGIADATGNAGQRMLAGAARTPGDGRQQIIDFLANRQQGQGRRIGSALDDALNAGQFQGMTAAQATDALTAQRGAQANALYRQAREGAGPVDVRGVLGVIDDRLGPMAGADIQGDSIDAAYSQIRRRLAAENLPEGVSSIELSDFNRVLGVKQDVQDMIGRAQRAGEGNRVRELSAISRSLDEALEASSGGYRAANDTFRDASRVIDQIEAGGAATGPRARTADVQAAYAAMTPEQQAAFRVGYSDPLLARVEGAAPGVNKARALMDDASQAELGMMARDPQALQEFLRREDEMFRTGQAAMGGSMTADNLADQADLAGQGASIVGNILSGRFGTAASQGLQAAFNTAQGRNTSTRDLIAQLLTSGDVNAALAPAIARQQQTVQQSAVVEALIRAAQRSLTGG